MYNEVANEIRTNPPRFNEDSNRRRREPDKNNAAEIAGTVFAKQANSINRVLTNPLDAVQRLPAFSVSRRVGEGGHGGGTALSRNNVRTDQHGEKLFSPGAGPVNAFTGGRLL